jgi:uncharacterized RDD family membrane protein YckC
VTAGLAPAGFRHRYAAWSLDFAVLALAAVALAWPWLQPAWVALGVAFQALLAGVGAALAEAMMAGTPVPEIARALLEDRSLLAAAGAVQAALLQLLWPPLAIYLLLSAAWHVAAAASPLQGSPGKRALGLRVADRDGGRVSLSRAIVRHLAAGLSWLTLNIGHLMALPTPHRALHDRIAGTRVLRHADARRLPWPAVAWILLQVAAGLLLAGWLLGRYVAALGAAFG